VRFHKNGTKIDCIKKRKDARRAITVLNFNTKFVILSPLHAKTQTKPTNQSQACCTKRQKRNTIPKVKQFNEK
jgi:hypothetical protein